MSLDIKNLVLKAPLSPGCYIYKDVKGKVLYVGKAIILRDRVKQYFNPSSILPTKIMNMVKLIKDIEYVITDSETEALVLESNLIKKYKPKYNVQRKDDKNYLFLRVNGNESFPRLELIREKFDEKARYYGPYYKGGPIKKTIKLLREVFPYRTCNRKIVEKNGVIRSSDSKPCLYYFLGLCQAPCAGLISSSEYKKNIKHIEDYVSKKVEGVIRTLEMEMKKFSKDQDFENAATLRDKINDLRYISERIDVEPRTDEFMFKIIKSVQKVEALHELLKILDIAEIEFKQDFKIECYDISNLSGTNAVGSMVVFVGGMPQKRLYRKYRIKLKQTPDDYAMLKEVLSRRFETGDDKKQDDSFSILPDLIVIDGGKGQLSSAYEVLEEKGLSIPIVGLAKKNEDVFKINNNNGEIEFIKKELPKGSEARYLMQRIRDETHRFGIDYHRKLREKAQRFSILSEIPGVGKVIGIKLLKSFGSLNGIRNASKDELYAVIKNKRTVDNLLRLLKVSSSIS